MAIEQKILPTTIVFYRRPAVSKITGKARTTLYRNIQEGLFPKPVQIGGDRVAWPSNEIEALNKARMANKTDDEIRAMIIDLEAARFF